MLHFHQWAVEAAGNAETMDAAVHHTAWQTSIQDVLQLLLMTSSLS